MFGIRRKIEGLRADVDMVYHETLRIRNLFAKDRHGTERPKVDMLADNLNDSLNKYEIKITNVINKLNERIEKMEKNENPKHKKG